MRILVVTQCFRPDIYAVNDIVATMVERKHVVTVLTGLPDYTTSKIPKEYKWFRKRHEIFNGAEVFRVSTIARHHGAIFRCLNYMSFAISGWLFAKLHNWKEFDVIYVWQVSPVTMAIPAIALQKRYQKPLFLYCLDIWPESVKAMGLQEKSLVFWIAHYFSKRVYQACDHIAVSSKPFFEYLKEINCCSFEKMTYLPQSGNSEFLKMDLIKEQNEITDFLFVGNIGKVTDVPVILQACAILKQRACASGMKVHIVGAGSEYKHCIKLADQLQLSDMVAFYGAVPTAKTIEYYRKADACLLTLRGDNKIGDTLPGKLQTYMAAGKPIVGAINGAGRQAILKSGCGICVAAGDASGLALGMEQFVAKAQMHDVMGNNGRAYFTENFTEEKHFKLLEKQLCTIMKESVKTPLK